MNSYIFLIMVVVGVANHVDAVPCRYMYPNDYSPVIEEPYPTYQFPSPACGCYDKTFVPEPSCLEPTQQTATSYSHVNIFPTNPFTPELMQYLALLASAPAAAPAPCQPEPNMYRPALPSIPCQQQPEPCGCKNEPCVNAPPQVPVPCQPDQPFIYAPTQVAVPNQPEPCAYQNQPWVYELDPSVYQPQTLPCPARACPTCASEIDYPMYYL